MEIPVAALLVLAQAAPPPPTAPGGSVAVTSVWDLAVRGGPTIILIGLCSIVAFAIVVERLVSLRRARVMPPGFTAALDGLMGDPEKAADYCRANGSPLANILGAAIERLDGEDGVLERHVEEAGQREVVRFRQRMRVLSALPQVSTMLGLLGTILGMIKTFQVIAVSGESLGKTELLARGIYEAWTATAAGLLVAIPVLIAYHAVQGKIDMTVAALDKEANQWLARRRRAASATGRVAEAKPSAPAAEPTVRPVISIPAPAAPALAAT